MSFRKKHKEAKEAEDVKISRAKDSQRDKNKSAAEQATPSPQSQRRTEAPAQQSGQESGQPEQAEQAEQDDEQPEEETPQAEDEDDQSADSTPVPDGTTAEIVQWVGDDKDRAQRALDKEQSHQKPRPGLTKELKKVLE